MINPIIRFSKLDLTQNRCLKKISTFLQQLLFVYNHKTEELLMKKPTEVNRRDFVKITTGALASIPVLAITNSTAQDLPVITEDDATAIALAYSADSTTVDAEKFANHSAEQLCSNCILYIGDPAAEYGPCGLFPGKSVATKGWCSTWVAKPA